MDFGRRNFLANLGGLAALTCSFALALYRSRDDDPRSAAFVTGAYGAVALLVYLLRRFERGEGERRGDKAAVWALATLLIAMFASRVAPLMPPAAGSLVYLVAAATAGAGFWALFILSP
ncbi:hypothetical protein C2845_PM09G03250 [Panicum miliaceum]|uniref:Uncharacterized protein n=1 Tax=Panicum miliaceum TaxID=4540 RepID=A0A3L6S5A9_PANMI|nr:hypothetical protein C2845_PM09G03250 [Panicum miliaceum]